MTRIFSLCKSLLVVASLLAVSASAQAQTTAADSAVDLEGIKCVMNGDANAKATSTADYRDAKVYFCCDSCAAKFAEEVKKAGSPIAVKANHQLVVTGQYVQKACPLTGKSVANDKTVEVGGAKVGLCCAGCLSKVNSKADLAAKAKLVFSNAAFKKGFEQKVEEVSLDGVKCLLMATKAVSKDFAVDYADHQVYFCCKGCKGKFEKDPTVYTALANHQLVQTKQVKQTGCPISGGAVKDDQSTEVGGVTVKYCCGKCKAKMAAATEAEQVEMAFGKEAFAKAFK